jgi:hypothetical protein
MRPVRIVLLILCASFASVAWWQQPGCKFSPFWAEFHKQNMERWNRCEAVLSVHNVRNLGFGFGSGSSTGFAAKVKLGFISFEQTLAFPF